ncbi:uncharacterized protein LOC62_05G007304 [Vanrija pseudolonga]|uniref:Uncharacterized protein n=1 Tax=Vanrija pseudolonga TaxID=143232 RepID=A0AAF0YF86_9TREE|nr:hypothetical protein LOC62_05G007304 [Vanrija pseudolonga]
MAHDPPTGAHPHTTSALPPAPTLLSPFPHKVLTVILAAASNNARVTCMRVNSIFYDVAVPHVHHTVKVFRGNGRGDEEDTFPLTGPHAAKLASHVRVLDVGEHLIGTCRHAHTYTSSFPRLHNMHTLRLRVRDTLDDGTDVFHVFEDVYEPRVCNLLPPLRPRTLVFRGTGTQTEKLGIIDDPERIMTRGPLSSVREVVVVFEPEVQIYDEGVEVACSLSRVKFAHPVKFTFVFWTKKRGDDWIPARLHHHVGDDYYDSEDSASAKSHLEAWWLSTLAFLDILFHQPTPEGGAPLLTMVNAGAIPSVHTVRWTLPSFTPEDTKLSRKELRGKLSIDERAIKLENRFKAWFDGACDARAPGDTYDGKPWDPATRDKVQSMRFLSMDEFLAEHNGDVFDEEELAGWR